MHVLHHPIVAGAGFLWLPVLAIGWAPSLQRPQTAAPPVPPDWSRRLASPDARVRLAAVVLLSEEAQLQRARGTAATEQVLRDLGTALAERVRTDSDIEVRRAAALALGHVRAPGTIAGPAWSAALGDPAIEVRRAAAEAIGIHTTRTPDERRRTTRLAQRLPVLTQTVVDAGAFIAPAVEALRDADAMVQLAALRSLTDLLRALGELPRVDPRDLTDLTQSYFQNLTTLATFLALERSLGNLAAEIHKRKLASVLADAAGDDRASIAPAAGQALEELGRWRVRMTQPDLASGPSGTAGLLLNVMRDALPGLRRTLETGSATTRLHALDAIETLGPEGRSVQSAVSGNLGYGDRFVRWAAARTLGKIGATDDEPTIRGLSRLVPSDDLDGAGAAAETLAAFGPKAKAAVPDLAVAVETRDPALQFQAIQALSAIGAEAKGAVAALAKALVGTDVRVRQAAARLLRQLGPDAAPALPALMQAVHDADPEVRQTAAEAVLKIISPP